MTHPQEDYTAHTLIAWQMPEERAEQLTLDFLLTYGCLTQHVDTFHYRHSTITITEHPQENMYIVELYLTGFTPLVADDITRLQQEFPEFHNIPYTHPEAPTPTDYDTKHAYETALASWKEKGF
jgi:hypothetical protein